MDTTTHEDVLELEMREKGLNAPRVLPAHIDASIVAEQFLQPAGTTLTICVLTLFNGFTVTGESAAASPENFDAEIGRRIARANAREKIWPLAGYLLKTRLWEQARAIGTTVAPKTGGIQLFEELQSSLIEFRDLVQILAADMPMPDELAQRVGQAVSRANDLVGRS